MFYEYKHLGTSNYFTKEYGEDFNFPPHMHFCFEFITVLDGEMKITVDEKIYVLKRGEALLIFPHQMHSLASEKCKHMLIIFSPDIISAYSSKMKSKLPVNNLFTPECHLISAVDKIDESTGFLKKKALLYSLCADFDENRTYDFKKAQAHGPIVKIFTYVDDNYKNDCSLEALSKFLGYDTAYLSRYFKRFTGLTYLEYVNIYRLTKACYLLDNTDSSILQCALDCGYVSLRTFNRNFKKQFNITPNEYRKK